MLGSIASASIPCLCAQCSCASTLKNNYDISGRDGNDDDDGDDGDDDDNDDGISFIPYSTKNNWLNRYPHAAPAVECDDDGKVFVYLNWRPYCIQMGWRSWGRLWVSMPRPWRRWLAARGRLGFILPLLYA